MPAAEISKINFFPSFPAISGVHPLATTCTTPEMSRKCHSVSLQIPLRTRNLNLPTRIVAMAGSRSLPVFWKIDVL